MQSEILLIIPFALLLLLIALGPIFFSEFWEKYHPYISVGLAILIAGYYLIINQNPGIILHSLKEYLSFILLLSALFVTSGGIHIDFLGEGNSKFNTVYLLFGAVLSNFIGTTGASIVLLRPFIRMNKNRIKPFHIVFYIFIVSNIGGAITPIGDPPLFIGFLRGVPFFWTIENVWLIWTTAIALLLVIFYFIDRRSDDTNEHSLWSQIKSIELKGARNLLFLVAIILSVFLDSSVIPQIPNFSSYIVGIREISFVIIIMLATKYSSKSVLLENGFNIAPMKEVAFLFIGIFITMIPALEIISHVAARHGESLNASSFYWGSGMLSSVLDNAPTYLNFLTAAMGKFNLDVNSSKDVAYFAMSNGNYLLSISVGCVFFGAMTYIGNGPNFMVKSISENLGIKMPSFFKYIYLYSLPILLPIFFIIWILFI